VTADPTENLHAIALIVLGFATVGCAYPVAGAKPTGSNPPPRTTPTSSPVSILPATGTARLNSAELRQIRVIAARPDAWILARPVQAGLDQRSRWPWWPQRLDTRHGCGLAQPSTGEQDLEGSKAPDFRMLDGRRQHLRSASNVCCKQIRSGFL
jgi:hypothetical protein